MKLLSGCPGPIVYNSYIGKAPLLAAEGQAGQDVGRSCRGGTNAGPGVSSGRVLIDTYQTQGTKSN
jgi:hypothetical protein